MAENNPPGHHPPDNQKQPADDFSGRRDQFALHYADPASPGYCNATRAAELAGYKGEPGSTQLAVQGHRLLKHPKIRRRMAQCLEAAGCTPELVAERLREGMNAMRTETFVTKDGQIICSDPVPDYAERRKNMELWIRLRELTLDGPEATDSAEDTSPTDTFMALPPGDGQAQQFAAEVAELAPAQRHAVRDAILASGLRVQLEQRRAELTADGEAHNPAVCRERGGGIGGGNDRNSGALAEPDDRRTKGGGDDTAPED